METLERNWEWQISVQQYKAVGGCRVVEGRADKSNREELGMTYISIPLTVKIQKKMSRIPVQNTSTPNPIRQYPY
jgi:hypothetical protein